MWLTSFTLLAEISDWNGRLNIRDRLAIIRLGSHHLRMELPDGMTGPNDSAYEKTEIRTGSPLDYVAEKLRFTIEGLHWLHARLRKNAHDGSWGEAARSFHSAVTAYLALKNLLGMATDQNVFDRLLELPEKDFERWLDDIDREGSVT